MSTFRSALSVFWVFFRIGASAFGGPAATQGLVYSKLVADLKWIGEKDFLDLMGMVNVLPGPNAVEMAMHIGHKRAGRLGFLLGGLAFMLPGAVIAVVLAVIYVRYSATPSADALLYGVQPVVIGVTTWSTYRLAKSAKPSVFRVGVAVAAGAAYLFASLNEVLILAACGLVMLVRARVAARQSTAFLPVLGVGHLWAAADPTGVSINRLLLVFLKAGVLLFGGGSLLLAVLHNELVVNLRWLTEAQLLEAITVGQVTPGPVLNTATFIGYLLAGVPGAVVATVAVLVPSFLLMMAAGPVLRLIRRSPDLTAVLDGVTLASIGMIGAVTVQLARSALVDVLTVVLAVGALGVLLWRPKFVLPLIACGIAVGLVARLVF